MVMAEASNTQAPNKAGAFGFLGPETQLSRAIAAFDWSTTTLGPIENWAPEFRTTLGLMMGSDYPAALWWGPDLYLVHNELYQTVLLRERGASFGKTFSTIWPELDDVVRPQFEKVMSTGRGMNWENQRIDMIRGDRLAETYWNYSFTPVLGSAGQVIGIFNGAREVTDTMLEARVNAMLVDIDASALASVSVERMIATTARAVGEHLSVQRAGFAEFDHDLKRLIVHPWWTDGSLRDTAGVLDGGIFTSATSGLNAGQTLVAQNVFDDARFANTKSLDHFRQTGVSAIVIVPVHAGGVASGGLFVQSETPRAWSTLDIRIVEAATVRLWQSMKSARVETARRETEARYRLIFEQANDIIFTADIDQVITDCNMAGAQAMGLPHEAIIGRSIADFVSPDDFRQTTSMLRQKIDHGGNTRHEVTVIGRDGRKMLWENNSTLIIDHDASPIGLLSISRDVTERRAFDERRELLIHELNHRVKNTLALVQAIALQTFPSGSEETAKRDKFIQRLGTLASAHDLLTREQWEGVTLADIVRWTADTLDRGEYRFAAGGPELRLAPKAAVALTMALHELGTNALKYGALSVPEGRVDLIWQRVEDRLIIEWRERGGAHVTKPTHQGFGSRMIERVLASDLGGRVILDFAPMGLNCIIDAPTKGNLA